MPRGEWVHSYSDKLLLLVLTLILIAYDIYSLTRTTDAQLQFINQLIAMVIGALINQVTGESKKGGTATITHKENPPITTAKIETPEE